MEENSASQKAPGTLYVTIGVQCAGKSTILREMSCKDIALDDHDGIYKQVPWDRLPSSTQARVVWEALTCSAEDPTNVKENWLARIYNGMPAKGFHPAKKTELASLLWDAICRVRAEGFNQFSETFEQLNFNQLGAAIEGSMKRLEGAMAAGQEKVAWGNTNRFLTDMYGAVTLATKFSYQVEFLILNDTAFEELLYRNVKRGMSTGKYIPAEIMWRCKKDVDRLVADGVSVEKVLATKGDRSLNAPNHNNNNNRKRAPKASGEESGDPGSEHHHHGRGRGRGRGRGGSGGSGGSRSPTPSPPTHTGGNMFLALEENEGDGEEGVDTPGDGDQSASGKKKKKAGGHK